MNIRRVRLVISGGFAGLVRGAEVGGDDLASDERRALERHAGAAAPHAPESTRDAVQYELEIHGDDKVSRVAFDELNTPADLADLVERLRRRSRPVRP
jgi:hypothetical protein